MDGNVSQTKILFKRLTTHERKFLLEKLVSQKSRVVFWKHIPRYYEARAFICTLDGNGTLTVDGPNIYTNLFGERLCLNFQIDGVDYFMQAKVISQFPENFRLIFDLLSESYRVEKRKTDRIVTYPDYTSYVYLKYEQNIQGDLVYFNKDEQRNVIAFHEMDRFQKSKLKELDKSLELDEGSDIIGFRVENISPTGISFFVSKLEYHSILSPREGKRFSMTLSLISQAYHLDGVELVSKMDYINQQFSGMHMYKVSAKFFLNHKLSEKIDDLSLGEKIEYAELLNQFEKFINNEDLH